MTLFERIEQLVPILEGWCTVEKGTWLAEIIVRERLARCVEIGVFGGRSLLPMALAVQSIGGYALGIDPYTAAANSDGFESADANAVWAQACDYESVCRTAQEAILREGVAGCCGILRAASQDVAAFFGAIDLVHIDGCHSELASCRDVKTWLPKVRAGGVLVLDDTDWPAVQAARRLLSAACGDPFHHDATWEAYRAILPA